jgi:hypothetical protein
MNTTTTNTRENDLDTMTRLLARLEIAAATTDDDFRSMMTDVSTAAPYRPTTDDAAPNWRMTLNG